MRVFEVRALRTFVALAVFAVGGSVAFADGPMQVSGGGGGGISTAAADAAYIRQDGTTSMDSGAALDGTTSLEFSVDGNAAGRIDLAPDITANGAGNTCLGEQSCTALNSDVGTTGGFNNTCIGGEACDVMTTGQQNTCIGSRSCQSVTTGDNYTCVGQGACNDATSAGPILGVGYHALLNATTQSQSIAIGNRAAEGIDGSFTGDNNVFISHNVALSATTAASNVLIGAQMSGNLSTGGQNTAVGYRAGNALTTGSRNTCLGRETCEVGGTAGDRTCVGNLACNTSTVTTTALGSGAGLIHTSGAGNTFLGYQTAYTATPANATTTGSQQTFVGYQAGQGSATQRTNATAVGYQALVDADNTVVLGNASVTAVEAGQGGSATLHAANIGSTSDRPGEVWGAEITATDFVESEGVSITDGYVQVSKGLAGVASVPVVPSCSGSGHEGKMFIHADTDVTTTRALCVCLNNGGYGWERLNGVGNCP